MRYALVLLTALLPTLAQARGVGPNDNPGPYTLGTTKPACENLRDIDDLYMAQIRKDRPFISAMWARLTNPDTAPPGQHCTKIRKGATVTVTKRMGLYECVVASRGGESPCYWAKGITPSAKIPFPDADWYLWE